VHIFGAVAPAAAIAIQEAGQPPRLKANGMGRKSSADWASFDHHIASPQATLLASTLEDCGIR